MKILILNGNPHNDGKSLDNYIDELTRSLTGKNHSVSTIKLSEKRIKYCIGCWSCWVKTPGKCFVSDDSHEICYEFIRSDVVLFASPIIMGFTSALLKKIQDKMIPLLHPYIEIVQNESHHRKRYSSYPKLGLLLEKGGDSDDDDVEIIKNIYRRFSLNFRSELIFSGTTTEKIEDLSHAIDSV